MEQKFKRRRLVVDPAMQFRLAVRIGWYLLLWTVLAYHVSFMFYVHGSLLDGGTHKGFAGLYLDFFSYRRPLILTVIVIGPLVLYDIIKFSNRIAGPLYRCRRVMRDMAAGKTVPEFQAREHDFLDDVFVDFNALIRAWNARVGSEPQAHNGNEEGGVPTETVGVAHSSGSRW
jgi:hypothetical protein